MPKIQKEGFGFPLNVYQIFSNFTGNDALIKEKVGSWKWKKDVLLKDHFRSICRHEQGFCYFRYQQQLNWEREITIKRFHCASTIGMSEKGDTIGCTNLAAHVIQTGNANQCIVHHIELLWRTGSNSARNWKTNESPDHRTLVFLLEQFVTITNKRFSWMAGNKWLSCCG